MCLSDIGRVVACDPTRFRATLDVGGRAVDVSTVALGLESTPPEVDDWLVVHTGLAVERLTTAQAEQVLRARDALTPTVHDTGQETGHDTGRKERS